MNAGPKQEVATTQRIRSERNPRLERAADWSSSYRVKLYKESSRVSSDEIDLAHLAILERQRSG